MRNEDIMYRPRPRSGHYRMDIARRAKQFAPFAALKGYEEAIEEENKVVEKEMEYEMILEPDSCEV